MLFINSHDCIFEKMRFYNTLHLVCVKAIVVKLRRVFISSWSSHITLSSMKVFYIFYYPMTNQ